MEPTLCGYLGRNWLVPTTALDFLCDSGILSLSCQLPLIPLKLESPFAIAATAVVSYFTPVCLSSTNLTRVTSVFSN